MMWNRRLFLKKSGLAALSLTLSPWVFTRNLELLAAEPAQRGKVLVLVIQRGAMDGLSLLPPLDEAFYHEGRPKIALKTTGESAALRLGNGFGLHPAMSSLKPYWESGTLAFVHQSGSPLATRSHFDAQDFLESGTPGDKNTQDGFLNRALQSHQQLPATSLRAIALQPSMPRVLQGKFPAISMNSMADYVLKPGGAVPTGAQGFEAMYQQATDKVFRGVAQEVFESLKAVKNLKTKKGDEFPKSGFGKRMREISTLIQSDVGLQVAVTDIGGWDTHINQGRGDGRLADRFTELAEGLAAFAQDLGPRFGDVCVVCVTEFGRTVKENGTHGTDHGHGSVMTVLGGNVTGRKVYGEWRELKPANLFEGRDLPITTDSRDVLAEVLDRHLGMKNLGMVFPKFDLSAARYPGFFRV